MNDKISFTKSWQLNLSVVTQEWRILLTLPRFPTYTHLKVNCASHITVSSHMINVLFCRFRITYHTFITCDNYPNIGGRYHNHTHITVTPPPLKTAIFEHFTLNFRLTISVRWKFKIRICQPPPAQGPGVQRVFGAQSVKVCISAPWFYFSSMFRYADEVLYRRFCAFMALGTGGDE